MKRRIKLNALAIGVALVLCAAFPYLLIRRARGVGDDLLEFFGLALILLGLLLRASARGYKAEHSARGRCLVTDGPYGVVRNPMYLGILISGMGIVLFIGRLWGVPLFLIGFFAQYLYLFAKEEKALERSFGQEYRDYRKRVPGVFPSPRSLFTRDIRSVLPIKAGWVKRELMSIVPVLLIVIAIERWEEWTGGGLAGFFHSFYLTAVVFAVFGFFYYFLKNEK